MVNAAEVLNGIPMFRDVLNAGQIEQLAAKCQTAVFPAGALLMTEGDFGSSMFALVEGKVSIAAAGDLETPHAVAELSAGDFVGEMSLLTGARRNASVEAVTEVVAVEIPKVALEQVLARAPDLIDSFGAVLARRRAELDQAAADAAHTSAGHFINQIKRFFGGS